MVREFSNQSDKKDGGMHMTHSTKPIPEGFHTITPSIVVRNAAEAINFYKRALGAEEVMRMPGPDGQSIMHAELSGGLWHQLHEALGTFRRARVWIKATFCADHAGKEVTINLSAIRGGSDDFRNRLGLRLQLRDCWGTRQQSLLGIDAGDLGGGHVGVSH